jgi:hypothetical protein
MTKEDFITWLRMYLDKRQIEDIALIREKLSLVNAKEIGYNYWSNIDPKRTSLAGEKLSYTVDATISDTFTVSNPDKQ